MTRGLLSSSAVLLVLISTAHAQQTALALEPEELPPVVVEGATVEKPKVSVKKGDGAQSAPVRGPLEASEAAALTSDANVSTGGKTVTGVPAHQIGSAVTVVTGTQLRAQQVRNAADALRSLPGVHVSQSGSGGGLTQVRIRGAEANHTLVLIDGIEASDPNNGELDWSNLMAEDIERIEVIRGAQSGIYGSRAIGGVINIITRGGKGPLTLSSRVEFGSYGTRDVSARASGGTDSFWLSVAGNYREQNDFNWSIYGDEDDPWDNGTINVKGGFKIIEGMTLDFVVRDTTKNVDSDNESFIPQTGLNGAVDTADSSVADLFLGGATLRWDMLGGALTHVAKANRNTTEVDYESEWYGPSAFDAKADTFSYLATYRFATPSVSAKHALSGFVENKREDFTPFASYADPLTRKREAISTVGEYRGEYFDRVFVDASVRHDDNDTFRDFTTWRSGVSVVLPEVNMRPHASVGTGVALPGMFEQFGYVAGSFIGNPNLKPEESFSWDVGVEFSALRGKALLDITYFNADLSNKIQGTGNSMINLEGESQRDGIEISGRILVTRALSLGASYTYLNAKDPNGLEEIRRAPHSGRADLNYSFDEGRGNFNLAAIYNGDTIDNNFGTWPATRVLLDEYLLVNAAISYDVQPGFQVFGRVENILDERYEEISGYNTLGVAAYAGVKITLEDPNTAAWAKYR
ncbi:TonB-dependent receptor plug domain-containing protein [Hyphomicrobium sp.]|uniref:TonB-dependent receptor plug domain-containing protein n=1 Tax=Hyphomicrobium sp. TaxID=82 RepID=UPI002E344D01|nr:TonB-dependent receptor [Hyphomicrobium sp.]